MILWRRLHHQHSDATGGQQTPFPMPVGTNGESDSAIDKAWGGLETTSRPELAQAEEAYRKGKSEDRGPETGPPQVESTPTGDEPTTETETEEAAAPSDQEETTEGEGEQEAEAESSEQDEPKAPLSASDKQQRAIERIMQQFRSPEEMAKSIWNIRALQNRTAEERNALQGKLDQLLADYDEGPDGNLTLKADAAARRLQQERGQSLEEPMIPDEKLVRAAVEQQVLQSLSEDMDSEDAQALLKGSLKPHVDRLVKNEIAAYTAEVDRATETRLRRIASIAETHFEKNPDDRQFRDEMSKWYERFPKEWRTRPELFEAFLPIGEVAKVERTKAKIQEALVEAYKAGVADGKGHVDEPAEAITPTGGRGGHGRGRPSGDPIADFKNAVLNAGKLAQLESLD